MLSKQLRKQYHENISAWDWDEFIEECKMNAEPDKENGGELVGHVFIGTVMGLTPSGKFYSPFACGNLDPCVRCGGKGKLVNRRANADLFAQLTEWANTLRQYAINRYGVYSDGKWSRSITTEIERTDRMAQNVRETKQCPICEGVGSFEALKDEIWREVLEEVAGVHSMFVTSGEGDPCNMLVGKNFGMPEDEEGE